MADILNHGPTYIIVNFILFWSKWPKFFGMLTIGTTLLKNIIPDFAPSISIEISINFGQFWLKLIYILKITKEQSSFYNFFY